MVEDLEENLNVKELNISKKMINKSVSFNAIKNMAFEIFLDEPKAFPVQNELHDNLEVFLKCL